MKTTADKIKEYSRKFKHIDSKTLFAYNFPQEKKLKSQMIRIHMLVFDDSEGERIVEMLYRFKEPKTVKQWYAYLQDKGIDRFSRFLEVMSANMGFNPEGHTFTFLHMIFWNLHKAEGMQSGDIRQADNTKKAKDSKSVKKRSAK